MNIELCNIKSSNIVGNIEKSFQEQHLIDEILIKHSGSRNDNSQANTCT